MHICIYVLKSLGAFEPITVVCLFVDYILISKVLDYIKFMENCGSRNGSRKT